MGSFVLGVECLGFEEFHYSKKNCFSYLSINCISFCPFCDMKYVS